MRELEEDKAAANPVGDRVTRLWDELIAGAEKVGETSTGALYRLRPMVAGEGRAAMRPTSGS